MAPHYFYYYRIQIRYNISIQYIAIQSSTVTKARMKRLIHNTDIRPSKEKNSTVMKVHNKDTRKTFKTRNKSNDYFESMQYRQDVRHIAHYHKRKHFPSCTRCSENCNNTCAENRKIRAIKSPQNIFLNCTT